MDSSIIQSAAGPVRNSPRDSAYFCALRRDTQIRSEHEAEINREKDMLPSRIGGQRRSWPWQPCWPASLSWPPRRRRKERNPPGRRGWSRRKAASARYRPAERGCGSGWSAPAQEASGSICWTESSGLYGHSAAKGAGESRLWRLRTFPGPVLSGNGPVRRLGSHRLLPAGGSPLNKADFCAILTHAEYRQGASKSDTAGCGEGRAVLPVRFEGRKRPPQVSNRRAPRLELL